MTDLLSSIQGGLIVSCQDYPGEPITHPTTITDWFATAVADAGKERHP